MNCVGSKAQRKGRCHTSDQLHAFTCTTDEEVVYSRDVGGHNIMKITCNLHRKSLSPEEQKGCRINS